MWEREKCKTKNQINENHSVYYVIKINVPFFHNNRTGACGFIRTIIGYGNSSATNISAFKVYATLYELNKTGKTFKTATEEWRLLPEVCKKDGHDRFREVLRIIVPCNKGIPIKVPEYLRLRGNPRRNFGNNLWRNACKNVAQILKKHLRTILEEFFKIIPVGVQEGFLEELLRSPRTSEFSLVFRNSWMNS